MALIKCDMCGKKISDTTSECIHCKESIIKINRCVECDNEMFENVICDNCGYEDLDKKTESVVTVIIRFAFLIKLVMISFSILLLIGAFFSPVTWFIHLFFGLFILGLSFIIEPFINWPAYVLKNLEEIKNNQKI